MLDLFHWKEESNQTRVLFFSPPRVLEFFLTATMAENNYSWWKLTFLRKKKSTPKVLYESPDIYDVASSENQQEVTLADGSGDGTGEQKFNARLEKIVDKSTKGKHVKVSNSGRFKEKKKVRPMLSENPNLFVDSPQDEKWEGYEGVTSLRTPSIWGPFTDQEKPRTHPCH